MNKVHKIIWSAALNTWVVASELAKGKQKSSTSSSTSPKKIPPLFRRSVLAALLISLLSGAYAQSWVTVNDQAGLMLALANGTTHIKLGQTITINTYINVLMNGLDIVIDGGKTDADAGNGLIVATTNVNGLQINGTQSGSLTFQNMSEVSSKNYYSMVYISNNASNISVKYDNITNFAADQHGFMNTNGGSSNSTLIFGNLGAVANVTIQEIAEVNKVAFTGKYHVKHTNGYYSFENLGATINTATMDFKNGADVKIDRTGSVGAITRTGDRAFAYTFEDGAAFELISNQNVLSGTNNNRGVQIGTYNAATGFGTGAKIILDKTNTGGAYAVNGIDNYTTNTTGIKNGASGAADVVYNLAVGSSINTTLIGIGAIKNSGTGSGIYIRNAGAIKAATGIQIENNGTGAVVLANEGVITSTTAGIQLLSTSNNTMALDNTDGVINASSGTGIRVGTGALSGNLNLNLTGGVINLTVGGTAGIEFNGTSANTHTITGTTINVNNTLGTAIKGNSTNNAITLKDTKVNVANGIGFSNLSGITFAKGGSGERNAVTVTGTGTGVKVANNLNELSTAYLDINVTSSTGTGIEVLSGFFADQIIVSNNLSINAPGATAIKISGLTARDFINNGSVNGNIVFSNGLVNNTITNNGKILGTLTTGDGDDTLILAAGSDSKGVINLGNGANNVTINDGAKVASLVTGVGNDTFNLIDLAASSSTDLGVIDAGAGVNELNLSTSQTTLGINTELKNFQTVSLKNFSDLVLVHTKNIASGTIDIDTNSQLTFAPAYRSTLTAALSGTGTALVKDTASVTLTKTSNFAGTWDVNQGGALTATNADQLGASALKVAGTLNLNNVATLNNSLTGVGLVNVDTTNSAFNFGANAGSAFAGTVDLKNSTFDLSGDNTAALTSATLKVSSGNITTVANSEQTIGNLDLNGGTTAFSKGSLITTSNLKVSDNSTIKVDAASVSSSGNLLDQDNDSGAFTQLVSSSNTLTAGDLAKLTLQNATGGALGDGAISNVVQGGDIVAIATHNYALSGDKGLSVGALLTQLDIQTGETLTLTSDGAADATLTAKLTGTGALLIGTDNVNTTINNANNDYTGATNVDGGILTLGSDNALGTTSYLNVSAGATANINGKTQTVVSGIMNSGTVGLAGGTLTSQRLDNNTSGTIDLAGGTLTLQILSNGGTIDLAAGVLNLSQGGSSQPNNGLTGAGTLNVNGGDFTLNATNSGLSAATNIAGGASVSLRGTGALGTSAVAITGDLNLYIEDTLANTLSGAGNVNTNVAVTLTGANTVFTGTQIIKADGTLTVGSAANIGHTSAKVNLVDASSKLIFNAVSEAVANILAGVAGSTVQITNSANMGLSGDNSYFVGKYDITGNSILSVSKDNNLGTSDVAIGAGSQLVLSALEGGALTNLDNTLTGTGILALSGSNLNIVNTEAAAFTGTFNIKDSSVLTVNSGTQLNNSATVNVATTSDQFNIASSAPFNLNNKLTGNGLVNVDTNNTAFSFGTNAGNAFAGTVDLKSSTFDLSGNNTNALTGATLKVSAGNSTTVGIKGAASTENINALDINSGTLIFNGGVPSAKAESTIAVNNLALTGGKVEVNGNTSGWTNENPVIGGNLSILAQNRGDIKLELISSVNAVTGGAGSIDLHINGVQISSNTQASYLDILQGVNKVATGTYNYGLVSTNEKADNGLYVNYGLTELNLLANDADALLIVTDANSASNKDLSVKLTGTGGLVVDASQNNLTISNGNNDYTGTTTVNAGTLVLGSNGALGQTSLLYVKNGATTNINGKTQTVGALTNSGTVNLGSATGSLTSTNTLGNYGTIDLAGGTLTSQRLDNNINGTIDLAGGTLILQTLYNNGAIDLAAGVLDLSAGGSSQVDNGLTGAGTLNIKGGDFMINGTNSGLTAATNIASGASVSLGGTGALGTSAVNITGDLNLYIADTLANTLSGNGNVNTNAAVTLTGANTGFTGTQIIKASGELTVGSAANLGHTSAKVNLVDASSKLIFNAVTDTVAHVLTGATNSIVEITKGSNMGLTGDNLGFVGKYDITGNSILSVSKDNNLGTSDVAIGAGSQLVLSALDGGVLTNLDNTLTGTGILALSGSNLNIVNTKAAAFTGTFNIKDSSALNVSRDTQLNTGATVNVATINDQFNIASSNAFNLNNKLTGNGLVNVDTNNTAFSFGTNAGSAFAGTVDLKSSTFDLSGNNTTTLTNATLKVSAGNSTTVGLGEQNIGSLVINGGTLYFNDITENAGVITSGGTIKANTIDARGTGNIRVDLPTGMTPGLAGYTVMQLDEGAVVVELATGAATGSGNLLTLTDKNGAPIGVDITQGIKNAGSITDSAIGTFNYGLTTGNGKDGLYVNYGLKQVELLGVGTDALKLNTTIAQAGTAASDLSAKVTGAGDLAIEADIGATASLSNTTNDYTGSTFVRRGSLRLDADSALGQTALLNMSTDTKVDINATTQTVGELQSALGSTLDLNSGHLTIKSGGLVEGALIGTGDLIVNANTLTINGANASLTAQVRIDAPATIGLNNVAGLGSSAIALAGILALDNASGDLENSITGTGNLTLNNASNVNLTQNSAGFAGKIAIDNASALTATAVAQLGTASITNDGAFTFNLNTQDEALKNTLVGSGDFIKNGTKRLSLTQSLGYTGKTSINEGSLFVGDNLTLGGVGADDVTIATGADLSGSGFVNGRVINYGSINVNNDPTRRALDSATLTINNSLDNHNTINISNSSGTVGNSLVVNGDYMGFGNSSLYMSTALGNDMTSLVDQFIIAGHAGGSTSVYVNNVGGVGASTSELGVRLIDVGSSDTTAFNLANTVVSGAYEYLLNRNQADQDWYLSSYVASDPIPVPLYRPDLGNHIANMESAVKSQIPGLGGQSGVMAGGSGGMRAMNRLGNNWANQETTDTQKLYSIWNVTTGGDSKGRAANGQIRYDYDSVGTLLGGDRSIFVGRSLIQLGAMVGTSKSDSSSRNLITGSRGTGEVDGTTFGLYGTWYLDSNSALSPFIDAFITYGRYKNEVKTWGNTPTKYNSKALSITLQGGYPIALTSNVVLEPQAQITYLDYSAKDHYDHSGTRVTQDLSGNMIGRVGAYVYLTDMPVKPYAALNLWYDNTSSTVKYNGNKVSSDKAGFMLEAKAGLEAQLSPNFSISGGVNYRQGNHSSKNYSGNIGFKYTF